MRTTAAISSLRLRIAGVSNSVGQTFLSARCWQTRMSAPPTQDAAGLSILPWRARRAVGRSLALAPAAAVRLHRVCRTLAPVLAGLLILLLVAENGLRIQDDLVALLEAFLDGDILVVRYQLVVDLMELDRAGSRVVGRIDHDARVAAALGRQDGLDGGRQH